MHMKANWVYLFLLSIFLVACATPKPPQGFSVNKSQASLAEASYSVSRSLVDLAAVAEASHPLPNLAPPPSPASYGMGGITSVDWSGPVEPLLKQIAMAANYRLRVLGTPPRYSSYCYGLSKKCYVGRYIT